MHHQKSGQTGQQETEMKPKLEMGIGKKKEKLSKLSLISINQNPLNVEL